MPVSYTHLDVYKRQVVTVPPQAAGTEGSSIYLIAGEKITVLDLLYGLMLRSGNDCAVTLALYHSGTVEAFAACMNARAQTMGAVNSSFVNPHGLPAEGHYTTALDLARIAAYALRNASFREIVSAKEWRTDGDGTETVQMCIRDRNMRAAISLRKKSLKNSEGSPA